MSFLQKFTPTLFILRLFGVCPFSINHQTNQIQFKNSSLLTSLIFIILFPLVTYKSYLIADRSIKNIFYDIFQISNLIAFLLNYIIYLIIFAFSYQLRYQHAAFLNQLNSFHFKMYNTFRNNKNVQIYYVTYQLYLLLFLYIFIVPYAFADQFNNDYSNLLFMMCFYWSVMSTIFIMIYVRYICTVLYNCRSTLIQQMYSIIFFDNNRYYGENELKFFNIFDELNELIILFKKAFNIQLQLSLLYNFLLNVISLYLIVLYFLKNYLKLPLIIFLVIWVILVIGIIVYVIAGFDALSKQVSLSY